MNDRPHHGQPAHRPVVFDPESGRWEVSPAYRSNPSIPPVRVAEPGGEPRRAPLDASDLHSARHRRPSQPPESGSSPRPGPRLPAGRRVVVAAAFVGTFLLGYLLGDGAAASGSPGAPDTGAAPQHHLGATAAPGPTPRGPSSAES